MKKSRSKKPPISEPLHETLAALTFHGRTHDDFLVMRLQRDLRLKDLEERGLSKEKIAQLNLAWPDWSFYERLAAKDIEQTMRRHPLGPFVLQTKGLGLASVGELLGEVGNLGKFETVSKLWAYCGMAVRDGHAPKKEAGMKLHFNPHCRVLLHRIVGSLILSKRFGGPHIALYDRRKAAVLARPRLGPSGCPFSERPHYRTNREQQEETGHLVKSGGKSVIACVKVADDGRETSAHVDADARRVVAKAILKDLWVEWRRVTKEQAPSSVAPQSATGA